MEEHLPEIIAVLSLALEFVRALRKLLRDLGPKHRTRPKALPARVRKKGSDPARGGPTT
jgi:hypothetical protein